MIIKRLLSVSILLTATSTLYAQTGIDKTAQQIAAEMIPGWNLGNTLEANRDFAITEGATYKPAVTIFSNYGGLESETAWQKTKTTQEARIRLCRMISGIAHTVLLLLNFTAIHLLTKK